jgi:hypothetical protein
MLVLSRYEGQALTVDEGLNTVTVTVIEVNPWRWWRWWRDATVILQVDGPEGMSAMPREVWVRE